MRASLSLILGAVALTACGEPETPALPCGGGTVVLFALGYDAELAGQTVTVTGADTVPVTVNARPQRTRHEAVPVAALCRDSTYVVSIGRERRSMTCCDGARDSLLISFFRGRFGLTPDVEYEAMAD